MFLSQRRDLHSVWDFNLSMYQSILAYISSIVDATEEMFTLVELQEYQRGPAEFHGVSTITIMHWKQRLSERINEYIEILVLP